MALVLVQHRFQYTAKDGRLVSIHPDESYILVSKTNRHWWHVRKEQHTRPFYVPAQYVVELPEPTLDSTGPEADWKPVDAVTPVSARETCRFSTFGFCEDISEGPSGETPVDTSHTPPGGETQKNDDLELYAKPHPVQKAGRRGEPARSPQQDDEEQPCLLHSEQLDFPLPPDLPIYDTIPELPEPGDSGETLTFERRDLNRTPEETSPAPSAGQVRLFIHRPSL